MRSISGLLAAVAIGLTGGLGTAHVALEAELGFGFVTVGPWSANPRAGGVAADPYTRAWLTRSGELPLGGGEGITFLARADSEGRTLDARCTYAITGDAPQARWWTLTAYAPDGRLVENLATRHGFTSREVERAADGTASIRVSRQPQPGNWLPIELNGRFKLAMRLYDTPLSSAGTIVAPTMPRIVREACA